MVPTFQAKFDVVLITLIEYLKVPGQPTYQLNNLPNTC